VLADSPTYRELWNDAALFADPRDAKAIAAAINRLCGDDDMRARMADRATERSKHFDLPSQAEAMASLYRGLLHRNSTLLAGERS
jgi:glycosyltransferase involved in cell wall biosynthesis